MILIVDIGMGNLGSIQNMLKRIKVEAKVSFDPSEIDKASKLVLPGVGAFDNAMQSLHQRGLIDVLNQKVLRDRTPILGICLGMQLLGTDSEEGKMKGLGWMDAKTVRFRLSSNGYKIPHMGWNTIDIKGDPGIFTGIDEPRFYFVHSYHMVCEHEADVLTTTPYGYDFVSSVHHENIWGTQFHPEKSHKFGMRLFSNFAGLE
ncbi:MAG: imidazole glycerol phosphate synthase subunit HisH [Methanomassiliicoccales archaeon]|nr:imidazole glycerol phosphate synthase subunit HisH [Methanomassiliicoccales archaeon]